jgi:hypothetical protein
MDIYMLHIENAINSNELRRASELMKAIEGSFSDQVELQYIKTRLNYHLNANHIELLVKKATQEETDGFYVRPVKNNAYETYLEILELSPEESRAIQGIERIRKKLVTQAKTMAQRAQWEVAETKIEDALLISPERQDAITVLNEIKKQRLSEKNEIFDKESTQFDMEKSDSSQQRMIQLHKTLAYKSIDDGRLYGNGNDNAAYHFNRILTLDPDNEEAISGLAEVENKISSIIRSYVYSEQPLKANEMLKNALKNLPKSKKLYNLKIFLAKSSKPVKHNNNRLDLSRQITELSNSAIVAINKKRYIFPAGRSAYDFYTRITLLHPGNNIGIQGRNEAKLRAYEQIDSDIRDKNYYIAHLRINRLLKLGVRDERLVHLQTNLSKTDKSNNKVTLNQNIQNNHLIYLLKFARHQEKKGVIWPPLSDNAYGVYKHVNDIEPLNKTAIESLSKLFNSKISSIKGLLKNKRLIEAERELLALDTLYEGTKEQAVITKITKELNSQKIINYQQQKRE